MTDFTLYYHHNSGHAYKVAMFFALADLPVTKIWIDINQPRDQRPAEFQRVAAYGEVPVLLHNEKVILQSDNILLYLSEVTGRFGPFGAMTWADIRQWLFWEANRLGLALPNLRFAHKFDPTMPTGAVEWLNGRINLDLNRFEKELRDGRAFLLGERLTICDLSLAGYIFWADEAKIDLKQWPRVFAWRENLQRQPGWKPPYDLMPPQ